MCLCKYRLDSPWKVFTSSCANETVTFMRGSRKFGQGDPDIFFVLNYSLVSKRNSQKAVGPPSRSNWIRWVWWLLEGVRTGFLRKHI